MSLPTISTFYGIVIAMYWSDHSPAHFHALYGEHEALIELKTLTIIRGSLPRRAKALVLEWAKAHSDELVKDWELCSQNQKPFRIPPLP